MQIRYFETAPKGSREAQGERESWLAKYAIVFE
jgi:hypothetical protein